MTPRRRLSDDERAGCIILIFPPLWPLGIAWLGCIAAEAVANKASVLWHRIKLKFKRG